MTIRGGKIVPWDYRHTGVWWPGRFRLFSDGMLALQWESMKGFMIKYE